MLDTMVAYLWPEGMGGFTLVGKEVTNSRAQLSPDLIFQTRDGYITAGAMSNKEWRGMCTALGHLEWLEDPRFLTVNDRAVNATERLTLTGEVLATNTSAYWLERLDAEGVPSAQVLAREDVITHPQIQANDLIHETIIPSPAAFASRVRLHGLIDAFGHSAPCAGLPRAQRRNFGGA